MKRARLNRQSWIDAGLIALVAEGPNALAAEPLARRLETTKGSFYWHFKDVPEFQKAVIRDWQSRAFADVVNALAEDGSAEQRLRRFGKRMLADRQDPALRTWARSDKSVARAIAQVDAERLTYLGNVLKQLGITNPEFAQSTLAALIGLPQIGGKTRPARAFETLTDLVVALQ
ncbi:TetR/AcrR family transcriptional regulator [uncultured Roseobacter sp.]|uniref:TetR/AcrR family transcriptional regulator n=1 Tax=uncultured Roseobacter sp. TaxID=114847 RepID=UPI00260E8ABB|nr:TetR/AcrR family transcriptional regulator [uncultured Roseobacter sp.]